MVDDLKQIRDLIARSPWRNAYWYARWLLSGDKYGAVGKAKERQMLEITARLEAILAQDSLSDEEKLRVCKRAFTDAMSKLFRPTVKSYPLALALADDIDIEFKSLDDIAVFILSMNYMVTPMNTAISAVPSNDLEFCVDAATYILDELGEEAVGKVISTWDTLGVSGCLDVERNLVVAEFTKLRNMLLTLSTTHSEIEDNMILSAFVQEFERRLAQKRKSRAGTSLEDALTFLFDRFNFQSQPTSDHFQTDIEVDKWFKGSDGWITGISCKRTLRERWKQVSSADSHALSRYKIKEIWHIITYDRDLSDDKLTMLGQQRQIFYLDEAGDKFKYASEHIGMKDYVRPLSQFIADIRKEQKG